MKLKSLIPVKGEFKRPCANCDELRKIIGQSGGIFLKASCGYACGAGYTSRKKNEKKS